MAARVHARDPHSHAVKNGKGLSNPTGRMKASNHLVVRGAREHNLKNIDVSMPKNKLTVITGVSGSGKSSLAFSTIYAEGQRRYLESLSAYARQFLEMQEKPDVDAIDGLSPAISIDQKTTSRNPRSTVATVTEIYDYLRLLYARVGHPHCPVCGERISGQSSEQIVDQILQIPEGTKFTINAPLARNRKGEFRDMLDRLRGEGFTRVKVNGDTRRLDEDIILDKKYKHNIDVVVDRLVMKPDLRSRVTDSVETAVRVSEGLVAIDHIDADTETMYSQRFACPRHGVGVPEMEPRVFSFNAPIGSCNHCTGLGFELSVDPDLLVTEPGLNISQGVLDTGSFGSATFYKEMVNAAVKKYKISRSTPWHKLSEREQKVLLYGDGGGYITVDYRNFRGRQRSHHLWFEGAIGYLDARYHRVESEHTKEKIEELMTQQPCPECGGARLRPEVLAVSVGGRSIYEFTTLSVEEAVEFMHGLEFTDTEENIARRVTKEIRERLQFLYDVGVGYLTLDRAAGTMSGGEAQRLRLASSLGSALSGATYVLDEPSIGIAPRDNDRLISTLQNLRDIGNTVLVVEHDEDTQLAADYLIDMGPGAGEHGGHVVAAGTPRQVMRVKKSITGQYLSGRRFIALRDRREPDGRSLAVLGAQMNNLDDIDVEIPVGLLTCVTGVSGSGKSTLVNEIVYKAVAQGLRQARVKPGKHRGIEGLEHFDKVIDIDQSPIGRTPKSNPVTYTKTFDHIRDLFAQTQDARVKGYKKGRFSFNVPNSGRCEVCRGDGELEQDMLFLPSVSVVCDACHGTRYNAATLEVLFKGKNISEVLHMTVEESLEFFTHQPKIKRRLQTLSDVGLSYIRLGQPATTLSGGEAQRVKLASELQKVATGQTLYILDEPSVGLASADIDRLLGTLQRLVDAGNTVIIIEHNLDIVKQADWVVDLGPEGGTGGGQLVGCGTPEEIATIRGSWTGEYLGPVIERTREHMERASSGR